MTASSIHDIRYLKDVRWEYHDCAVISRIWVYRGLRRHPNGRAKARAQKTNKENREDKEFKEVREDKEFKEFKEVREIKEIKERREAPGGG